MEGSSGRSHLSAKIRKAANQHLEEKNYWLDKLSGHLVKSSFPGDCPEPGVEKEQNAWDSDLTARFFPG
jgi:hypothetical protein